MRELVKCFELFNKTSLTFQKKTNHNFRGSAISFVRGEMTSFIVKDLSCNSTLSGAIIASLFH